MLTQVLARLTVLVVLVGCSSLEPPRTRRAYWPIATPPNMVESVLTIRRSRRFSIRGPRPARWLIVRADALVPWSTIETAFRAATAVGTLIQIALRAERSTDDSTYYLSFERVSDAGAKRVLIDCKNGVLRLDGQNAAMVSDIQQIVAGWSQTKPVYLDAPREMLFSRIAPLLREMIAQGVDTIVLEMPPSRATKTDHVFAPRASTAHRFN